eukprot:12401803-Karenia_brevis.AAC.1
MYLRPGELEGITGAQIVRPPLVNSPAYCRYGLILSPSTGSRPGKTRHWDEAIILDTCEWIGECLGTLKSNLADQSARIWPYPVGRLQQLMTHAVARLGLGPL